MGPLPARHGGRAAGGPQRGNGPPPYRGRPGRARRRGAGHGVRGGGAMTPATRLRWLLGLGLLGGLTGWLLVRGSAMGGLGLALLLLSTGLAAYQLWRPWASPRCWVRVRYHADTPPDPLALRAAL